jgi:hypothetical protein
MMVSNALAPDAFRKLAGPCGVSRIMAEDKIGERSRGNRAAHDVYGISFRHMPGLSMHRMKSLENRRLNGKCPRLACHA